MAYQHGFETASGADARSWLWVASILSMIYSLFALGARLTVKWDLLFWDDVVLAVAYVFAIAHYGILFSSIYHGLGASHYFISRILAFVALCLTKFSLLIFIRRIFSGNFFQEERCFRLAYTATAIYGLVAICLSSAGCSPRLTWVSDISASCDGIIGRWIILTLFDGATEIMIFCLPSWFVSRNQIKNSKKAIIIFVFSFRLFVAAFSVASTATYLDYLIEHKDFVAIAPTVALQEILLGFSLLSASIPCLRSFLWAFMSTGLMTVYGDMPSVHLNNSSSATPLANNPVKRRTRPFNRLAADGLAVLFSPDEIGYKCKVTTEPQGINRSLSNSHKKKDTSSESVPIEPLVIYGTREVDVERS